MLRLTVAPDGAWRPVLPDPSDPSTEVWRDHDGTVCALGQTIDGECWLHLPGVGSFRFGADAPDVEVVVEPSASRYQVLDAYYRTVLPFALQVRGLEVLHASAVRAPTGVIALCAVKETGKSTIAYALSRRGCPLWADDAVVLSGGGDRVEALSVPFAVRLRPASAAFFGRDGGEPGIGATRDGSLPPDLPRAPLAAICVLERASDLPAESGVVVERLTSAAAFTAVLAHAYCFTLTDAERKQRTVEHYLDFVTRVPVFRVSFGAGLEKLPAITDAIEQAVGAEAAAVP